jgi:hypothetical protein
MGAGAGGAAGCGFLFSSSWRKMRSHPSHSPLISTGVPQLSQRGACTLPIGSGALTCMAASVVVAGSSAASDRRGRQSQCAAASGRSAWHSSQYTSPPVNEAQDFDVEGKRTASSGRGSRARAWAALRIRAPDGNAD